MSKSYERGACAGWVEIRYTRRVARYMVRPEGVLPVISRILFIALMCLGAVACGGPQEFVVTGTSRAAGADGLITVEDIEGNRLVTVEMENLPPPDRISEGSTVYLVWLQPQGQAPTMAGTLEFDADARTGRLRATTPQSRFEVLVTAERNATVAAPSDIVVARQRVGSDD